MNKGEERRSKLLDILRQAGADPVPGFKLAEELQTSRQAIVHDIALLRSAGEPIVATSRGYMLATALAPGMQKIEVVVRHRPEDTPKELYSLVDVGVRIVDVAVLHPIYGELRGRLELDSRADVEEFLKKVSSCKAHLLSELTDGLHMHTLAARDRKYLDEALRVLEKLGFLVKEDSQDETELETLAEARSR